MKLLEINNLNFRYKKTTGTGSETYGNPVLENISLSVEEGSIVTLCGPTGCGKSTLLHLLKQEIAPAGEMTGTITFDGSPLSALSPKEQTERIALLFQNPEDQTVTDKVWHEIAYGLENLGYSQSEMENKVAESLSFFRLEHISREDTAKLSGGQKQLVLLASLLAISPKLLLLDEPISQLDPEAAEIFLSTLKRLHDVLGITMIIAEHRIENVLPITDSLVLMNEGRIVASGAPNYVYPKVRELLPRVSRTSQDSERDAAPDKPSIVLRDLYFRYEKKAIDVISGLSAEFMPGKVYGIFGCNAAGKTTLLNLVANLCKPQEGKIIFDKKKPVIAYLPQNVELLFIGETIKKELSLAGLAPDNYPDYVNRFDPDASPFDLSGGEKQLLALAKITASSPDIILLDEPTKGLDSKMALVLLNELKRFTKARKTVIMSTHDLDFAYASTDFCSIMSMGRLTKFKSTEEFFSSNRLYSI